MVISSYHHPMSYFYITYDYQVYNININYLIIGSLTSGWVIYLKSSFSYFMDSTAFLALKLHEEYI